MALLVLLPIIIEYSFIFQASVQDELIQVQPKFKSQLLEAVEVFREDVSGYEIAYELVISLKNFVYTLHLSKCSNI